MPYKRETIRLDLAQIGQDGYWVDLSDPRMMPEAQFAALKDSEDSEQAGRALMQRLILAWNLEDAETGEALQVPSQDETALGRVPLAIAGYVGRQIIELIQAPLSPSSSPSS